MATNADAQGAANAMARFLAAVDSRDWDAARRLMSDPMHLDYSSFGGGPAADLAPDAILAGWKAMLPGFDSTHHQIGNLDVELRGSEAVLRCYVTATHVIGQKVWTVAGAYWNALVLADDGWKLSRLVFVFKHQSGATDLPQEAQKRAAARAEARSG